MARRKAVPRPTRTSRIVSYRETSDSVGSASEDNKSPPPERPPKKHKPELDFVVGTLPPSRRRPKRSNRNKQNSTHASSIPSDDIIPNWTSLPHEILVSIFRYAAHPLLDDSFLRPKPSLNWLLRTARICKAFCEPALTALYESPPLFELAGPHGLLKTLQQDASSLSMPYAAKVKRLELDAYHSLAYTVTGLGRIDLAQLISRLPHLSAVHVIDESDTPPYRAVRTTKPWVYPSNLFSSISESEVRLRSWHWNAQLVKRPHLNEPVFLPEFAEFALHAHQTPALNQLKELSISHLALYERKERKLDTQDTPDRVDRDSPGIHLKSILSPLRRLQHLSLTSCSAFESDMPSILQALPSDLRSLAIKNTQGLYAAPLITFLQESGRQLRELVLDHNQALNLSFLTDLKQSCPELRRLHMDMTFYNTVGSYKEKDPLFDALLLPDDTPTWPTTLQSIELHYLRQWESEAAERFFASLIEAAAELLALHALIIKAILSIGWRDRAGFRETWIARLQETFLSKAIPPNPAFASKRAFREAHSNGVDESRVKLVGGLKRSFSEGNGYEPENAGRMSARRSQRIKENDVAKHEETQLSIASRHIGVLPEDVHGLCEIVDISIDNFRPAEFHYEEADFIDSEVSDDDWNDDAGGVGA